MGKDAKKAASTAATVDPAVEAQIALAQERFARVLQASQSGSKMGEVADMMKRLSDENAHLKRTIAQNMQKEDDTYHHTQARLEAQAKALVAAEQRIKEQGDRLVRVPLEIKAAAEHAKSVMQSEIDDLSRKLRDRESALERLADFRKERDDLIAGERC